MTCVPIFLCTQATSTANKLQRLRRIPALQREFLLQRCRDVNIDENPGQGVDHTGEFIVGMALVRYDATWSQLYPMNDEAGHVRLIKNILCEWFLN